MRPPRHRNCYAHLCEIIVSGVKHNGPGPGIDSTLKNREKKHLDEQETKQNNPRFFDVIDIIVWRIQQCAGSHKRGTTEF